MALEKAQENEGFLTMQFTSVLDVFQAKYQGVGNKFMESVQGSFEENGLKTVMDSLRAALRENILGKGRRVLWAAFEKGEKRIKAGMGLASIVLVLRGRLE